MDEHAEWDDLCERRMAEPGAAEAYEAARIAFELGRAARKLREHTGRIALRRRAARPSTR
ncbi:hypothetical protein EV384_1950 [Micromonospora kangleipakensis]|uniref:Uncharacterized protein n=1 Tax=Micromonospora kangleipakensis TaxID=1077942 RepID=A0A4Q8B7A1_9ACTN|nr:hypothetical protein [Micromonospora kangleipakensis]RZU73544.1 hypothetical protein EV384_1950 [Micromonospora kangleipakensis]